MIDVSHRTIAEAFLRQVVMRGDAPALLDEGLNVVLSWRQYGVVARRVAAGLRAMGLRPGDTVGLLLRNRPEFHVADVAALLAGATPFSMYNTSAAEQLADVIENAGCTVVFTEPAFEAKLCEALELGSHSVRHIVVVGEDSWTQLLATGQAADGPNLVPGGCGSDVSPDDAATVIYTSGTTGPPKGVELSHRSILNVITELTEHLEVRPNMRTVSYLPMAHIAERAATHYVPIVVGSAVVCCPDADELLPLLARVQPQTFFSPPRLWEKLRTAMASAVAAGRDPDVVRHEFGFGRLQIALTGAAPCPPSVIEYFHSIGIPLRELYGMSETGGLVSVADLDDVGSVGRPLPSYEVRLDGDGELLVRGPSVMTRYRNRPQETAEAIDADGWLRTGDIARIDDRGRIWIIDRKKELIINAAGKNMSPANIEARIRESGPLISQVCVIGDGRPYNVALILIDPIPAARFGTWGELEAAVHAHVARANERLARVEQIKRFALPAEEWLPDSDELTPTMKLKRRSIDRKYAIDIDLLYASALTETGRRP